MWRVLLTLAVALTLCGCNDAPGVSGVVSPATPAFPMPDAPRASLASQSGEYRIAPQDTLDVSVYQVPTLNRTAQVDGAGKIDLPLLGPVTAAGKTVRQLEATLTQQLGAKYLRSPQVTVSVKDAIGQRVTVDGEVTNPGVYSAAGGATLMQILAQAKGLTDVGDPSGIIIFRTVNGQRVGGKFDLATIRTGEAHDPTVYGGDTIVVDQSGRRAAWKAVRDTLPVAGFARVFF